MVYAVLKKKNNLLTFALKKKKKTESFLDALHTNLPLFFHFLPIFLSSVFIVPSWIIYFFLVYSGPCSIWLVVVHRSRVRPVITFFKRTDRHCYNVRLRTLTLMARHFAFPTELTQHSNELYLN